MASINKVIIIGNLGSDPDVKSFQGGGKIANVSIATSERWTDKQTGEPREITEWHRVTFHDRLAEIVEQYLKKGSAVYVEGSLRTRKWTDKDGNDRYITEIRAQQMQMLGSRSGGGNYDNGSGYQGGANGSGNAFGNRNNYSQNNQNQDNYGQNAQNQGGQSYQNTQTPYNQAGNQTDSYPQNNAAAQSNNGANTFAGNDKMNKSEKVDDDDMPF